MNRTPVSFEGTVTSNSGGSKIPFVLYSKLVYFVNDSSTVDVEVNFNRTVGENGTFTIKAGEILSDVPMYAESVSLQAVGSGNTAEVRLLGV